MMTITLGWWLVPTLVSIIGWIVSHSMTSEQGGSDWFGMNSFFTFVTYLMFFVVPSLIAWLVWALLR